MDRDLVNTQIVSMRKIVRNVKRFVFQKLNKQIKKLDQRLHKKQNNNLLKKFENKINNKRKELIAIKGLNVDEVSKQSLIHNKTYFEDIIKSSTSSVETKALARIAINDNIDKVVNKFKDENPNCDQWLPSQIELWQQKKSIKRNRILEKKSFINEDNNESEVQSNSDQNLLDSSLNDSNLSKKALNSNKTELNSSKSELNSSKSDLDSNKSDSKSQKKLEVKSKPKKISKAEELKSNENKKNVFKIENQIKAENQNKTYNEEVVKKDVNETKPKSDPFFLNNDLDSNDEQLVDSIDVNVRQQNPKNRFENRNFKTNDEKRVRFSKRIEKSDSHLGNHRNPKNPNIRSKFENNETKRSIIKGKSNTNWGNGSVGSDESLHPSWAAKRSVKDKFKIDLNQKPLAKKIKFN